MLKKVLGWALLAFIAFFVLSNPSGAATAARHLAAGLASAGTSLGRFFTTVTSGGHR
jgi:hypothetical protein